MQNNKYNFAYLIIAITPAIAMLSGLFMAAWVPLIILLLFTLIRPNVLTALYNLSSREYMLIIWAVYSSFWSFSTTDSLIVAMRLTLVMLISYVIIHNSGLIKIKRAKLFDMLMLGLFLACVIFLVEKYTNGVLFRAIRKFTQTSSISSFHLYWLDRGVCILSLSSWPMIYMLRNAGYNLQAFFLYAIILIILLLSDSSSGVVAYAIAGAAFLLAHSRIMSKFIAVCYVFSIFAMPVFSIWQNPQSIDSKFRMPISYIHRLFIWQFVAEKALEFPIEGHGIGAARDIGANQTKHIEYEGYRLHPLPIHPHNNIMQIWLELGIVGLFVTALWVWRALTKLSNITNAQYRATSFGVFTNYFVIGMISFGLWQSWWMMAIPFSVLLMIMVKNSDNDR